MPPMLAWVHRARYVGPKGRKPAEELHGTSGLERAAERQARLRAEPFQAALPVQLLGGTRARGPR